MRQPTEHAEPMVISSLQNARVKQLVLLQQKSQERRRTGLFVVEGRRELQQCIDAGYEVEEVWVVSGGGLKVEGDGRTPQGQQHSSLHPQPSTFNLQPSTIYHVTPAVYEKIAYRGSTEGIIGVVRERPMTLDALTQLPSFGEGGGGSSPLIVVLESVEKPGNLGAVLRSADAAGADAVIVCDPLTDLYNPNLIRASLGARFSVPTIACTSEECISFFKQNNIRILTAQLQDSKLYYDTDMRCPTAIVMGTESTGLTDLWRRAADAHIRIPMLGRMDSLNVSVSAAILLFEAVRQRQNAV